MKYYSIILTLLLLSACGHNDERSAFSYPCSSLNLMGTWIGVSDTLTLGSACGVKSERANEVYWVNDGDARRPSDPLYNPAQVTGSVDLLIYEPKVDSDEHAYSRSCAYVIDLTAVPNTLKLVCYLWATNSYLTQDYTR